MRSLEARRQLVAAARLAAGWARGLEVAELRQHARDLIARRFLGL